jgi:type I restriction enzyme S subunit
MTGATIGKIGYLDFDTAGNQSVAGFLNLINVHSLFLFYQMQVNTNQILTLAGGAAQTGINKSNIESLKIQIPNLVEQNKIANFLSAIDDKINHCQAQIEKMEVWKKGLLQQMFV